MVKPQGFVMFLSTANIQNETGQKKREDVTDDPLTHLLSKPTECCLGENLDRSAVYHMYNMQHLPTQAK